MAVMMIQKKHLLWMSLFSQGQKAFYEPWQSQWFKSQTIKKGGELTKQMQLLDLQTYLRDDLLVKVDRASMFNSLEIRVPFLDPRIIDFAFSIQTKHLDFFTTKKMLRELLKNKLPKTIVYRKKRVWYTFS